MDGSNVEYSRLSKLTLLLMVLRHLGLFFVLVIITILLSVGASYVPAAYASYAPKAFSYLITADLFFFLVGLFLANLEYSHYGILAGDEDIKIRRGLFSIEEVGVPYRRIKEVKQERSLLDQIIGSSAIIITILGEEEGAQGEESKIILGELSGSVAEDIQNKILGRAEVEKVAVEQGKIGQ